MKRHGAMNRIFRLVWSQVNQAWVAVPEVSRGQGKSTLCKLIGVAILSLLGGLNAQAGSTGAQVIAGAGAVIQSGSTTTITQSSQNLSLNWKSFNIAPTETVNFVQPSTTAIAVNRIYDTNGSQILGRLNANGQVFLINPNGILFGAGAQVNVGGLVASTLDFDAASLNNNSRNFSGTGSGSIVNLGTINANGSNGTGGFVALLGNSVSNQGSISAPQGTVALGAGSAATLTFQNNSLVKLQIDQSVLNSLSENGGVIHASGGLVLMSAGAKDALLASVVNNTGVIEARTVANHSGNIVLLGGMAAGTVNVAGTLDASAPNGGDGGFIETSAAHVRVANAAYISTAAPQGKTGTWLIDPTDFTIAASGGDVTGATLGNLLASNSVTVQTANGAIGTLGDITVNDAVSWSTNNRLTLDAYRNININQSISATGSSGSLALLFGQGVAPEGSAATYNVKAAVNLSAGQNFSTTLGLGGTTKTFTVINSVGASASASSTDLQGISGNVAGNYALGSNINSAGTSAWNSNTGFTPIAGFTGTLDGLGHSISNLVINRPGVASVGLIGTASAGAVIQNIGLLGGYTIGGAGTGALVGSGGTSTVTNSYATGNVNGAASTGGLVGTMTTGNITNSYATGNVNNISAASVGGLLGSGTTGNISNSYATGSVTGGAGAGGLVGALTSGNVSNSYASGAVIGGAGSGGLVGTITTGNITNTYATGSVKGDAGTGGLVGVGTTGVITNSYATGFISGTGAGRGGLIGSTSAAHVSSFWDVSGTGMTTSTGGTGVGMTTTQLQTQANFTSSTSANKNNNPAWDLSNSWIMYDGFSMPLLRSFLTPLTVSANNVSKTYDGASYTGNSAVSYSSGSAPSGNLVGTLAYGGSSSGASNAGGYAINLSGLYSNQQGYLINYAPGTLSVAPAPVSISGVRAYDGTNALAASIFSLSGLVRGQDLTFSGSGSMADQNVGINKAVTLDTLALRNGNTGLSSNYTLVGGTDQVRVNAAALTITAGNISKTYDGTLAAAGNGNVTSGSLFGTDTLSTNGLSFTDKNVGNDNKIVTANGTSVLDGNGGSNYKVTYVSNNTSTIDARALNVVAQAVDKIYDGTTTANVSLTDNRVMGDVLTLSLKPSLTGSATSGTFISVTDANGASMQIVSGSSGANFADKNVAVDKTVFVVGIQVQGADARNYTANTTAISTASVTPKALTVLATGQNKVYDGSTTDALILSSSGVVRGDNLQLKGSGTFADANAGTAKAVAVTGITATGGDAGNYSLNNITATSSANITPKIISVVASGTNKEYDGNTNDTVNLSSSGLLMQDLSFVQLSGTGAFTSKNVGVGKAIAVSNISASGSLSDNYQVKNTTATAYATVTAKNITVAADGSDKVYDGSTTGAVTLSSNGVISGDTVNFANSSALFGDKNVGTGKVVTVSGISLKGTDAKNYTANTTAISTANITPKGLTVLAVGQNKIYDGNTTEAVTLSSTGMVKGDNLLLAGNGSFVDANAGTAKTINVSGITATGNDAGNYSLNSTTASTTASISQKSITVQAIGVDKIYDGTTSDVVNLSSNGVLAQDMSNVQFNAVSVFTNKNVGVGKAVVVSNINATGSSSGNYKLSSSSANAYATVTAKNITVAADGSDKVYDGSTTGAVTLSSNGVISGDTVNFANSSALFGDKNVGTGKVVTVSGISLSGTDARNYSYNANTVTSGSGNASITIKNIAVTATGSNKVYDGTTTDVVNLASSGIVKGDSVSFTNIAATLDSKNVGIGKVVTVTGIGALGTDALNYSVSNTTATTKANVTPLSISVIATGTNKNFDGNTKDAVTLQTNGMIAGDALSFASTSAKFASSAVGVNKVVTVYGVNTLGVDAANYRVINKTVTTTATIK
jgi:filamentous hemagglutinin family protein